MEVNEQIIFEELEEVVMSYVANCHHSITYYILRRRLIFRIGT